MGQSFEAAGESSDPLEIRLSVTCGDQSFFKCLGVTRVIVDEKYIVVCIAHCQRRLKVWAIQTANPLTRHIQCQPSGQL
jgi:hypothetical protein